MTVAVDCRYFAGRLDRVRSPSAREVASVGSGHSDYRVRRLTSRTPIGEASALPLRNGGCPRVVSSSAARSANADAVVIEVRSVGLPCTHQQATAGEARAGRLWRGNKQPAGRSAQAEARNGSRISCAKHEGEQFRRRPAAAGARHLVFV